MRLFGFETDFDDLKEIGRLLENYAKLWQDINDFAEQKQKWVKGKLQHLSIESVSSTIKYSNRTVILLKKQFEKGSQPFRILMKLKEELEKLHEIEPVIEVLTNPGLATRHWKQIEKILDMEIDPEQVSLSEFFEKQIDKKLHELETLGEKASKEFQLEKMLNTMKSEWVEMNLDLAKWKTSNVKILKSEALEEIQTLLDEHIIKAQTIRSNPSVEFMKEKAEEWERTMIFIQDALDNWIKVQ